MNTLLKITLSVGLTILYTLSEVTAAGGDPGKKIWETIPKSAFYLALVYLIFELVHVAKALHKFEAALNHSSESLTTAFDEKTNSLSRAIKDIEDFITNDHRIIFARPKDNRGKHISVIGIEEVGTVPEPFDQKPSSSGKWARSLCILRFDRLQDLLFSEKYLRHYLALRQRVETQSRILIVNDTPRCVDAVRSFLQISEGFRIDTFVYSKREYYRMLEFVSLTCQPSADAAMVREILEGNPEVNLMVENGQFRNWTARSNQQDSEFVLRFLSRNGEVLTRSNTDSRDITHRHVLLVLQIMSLAMHEDRRGLRAFDAASSPGTRPENLWSERALRRLQWSG